MRLVATRGSLPDELWGIPLTQRERMDMVNGYFEDDELHNNSDTRWFEDDLQISYKLQTLDLLPPGHVLPSFAVGETLPIDALDTVQPSGIHKSWMSPYVHPVQLIELLTLPYSTMTEHAQ